MAPLHCCLLFSALLFALGMLAILLRSNAIFTLLGVELMLNAANVNFIAFWRFPPENALAHPQNSTAGILFVIFAIAVAAAEAAVGLALIIAIHRQKRSIRLESATTLQG
ncbi:MAG: NADH-quinone oxidoreductase subunit NuoK [Puniceicoccales bacterium]|jgi:NADH-quinone oxidoreductase subunit K|nr:NADH-quinone oxidoreductase subunit NuoK [Puniceicoccales bacterium]